MGTAQGAVSDRRVLVLQHSESETLGTIEDALKRAGVSFEYLRIFQGQSVPHCIDRSAGLIVMGGPISVYETDRFPFLLQEMKLIEDFLKAQRPILGVCLGSQLLAAVLGAAIRKGRQKEIGWFPVQLTTEGKQDPLWFGAPPRFVAFHWHGDVFDLPKGAVRLASSDITEVQSYRFGNQSYGVLFHLEVAEQHVIKMLEEFEAEVQQENLTSGQIVKESERYMLPLQNIGAGVFRRWIELL